MGCGASKQPVAEKQAPRKFGDEIKKMEEQLLLYMNEGADENLRLTCWDFGGQDTFYGLHHLYIGRQCVYVLMFNMKWFLDPSHSEFEQHLAFVRFWLDTIFVHAVDPKDGSMAPIVLVGTHKDEVDDPAVHEFISKMFDERFRDRLAWSSVLRFDKAELVSGRGMLWFFPVDNKVLGKKDPVMAEIKKVVQEVVKEERYVKEKVPFAWLRVLERLQAPGMDSCVELTQVMEICREVGMEEAGLEEQTVEMLRRFSELGQLMHHDDDALRHLVILDPGNYLVDAASRIICQHDIHENEFHKQARQKHGRLYARLRDGILDTSLLEILWRDRPHDIANLQALLVKFGFFVPILHSEEPSVRDTDEQVRYLVPHLLSKPLTHGTAPEPKLMGYIVFAPSDAMQDYRKQGYISSVYEVQREGFLPMGLVPAVIGQVVGACQRLYGLSIEDMELSATHIATAFGKHGFFLRQNKQLEAIELGVRVDSANLIQEHVLDLVGKAVARMVPSLGYALVLDRGSLGNYDKVNDPMPKGPFIIIDGPGGVQEMLDRDQVLISMGPGDTIFMTGCGRLFCNRL